MHRPVSLFFEPSDGYAPSRPWDQPWAPEAGEEPAYFLQVMESLRERRDDLQANPPQDAAAEQDRTVSGSAAASAIV